MAAAADALAALDALRASLQDVLQERSGAPEPPAVQPPLAPAEQSPLAPAEQPPVEQPQSVSPIEDETLVSFEDSHDSHPNVEVGTDLLMALAQFKQSHQLECEKRSRGQLPYRGMAPNSTSTDLHFTMAHWDRGTTRPPTRAEVNSHLQHAAGPDLQAMKTALPEALHPHLGRLAQQLRFYQWTFATVSRVLTGGTPEGLSSLMLLLGEWTPGGYPQHDDSEGTIPVKGFELPTLERVEGKDDLAKARCITTWVSAVKTTTRGAGTPRVRADLAVRRLQGPLAQWAMGPGRHIETLDHLQEKLLGTFVATSLDVLAIEELLRGGAPALWEVGAWCARYQALAQTLMQAGWSEPAVTCLGYYVLRKHPIGNAVQFAEGVHCDTVRVFLERVWAQHQRLFREQQGLTQNLHSQNPSRHTHGQQPPKTSPGPRKPTAQHKRPQAVGGPTLKPQTSGSKDVKCFACGEVGHKQFEPVCEKHPEHVPEEEGPRRQVQKKRKLGANVGKVTVVASQDQA